MDNDKETLWSRQCQVCLNATSKYDHDTGYDNGGCVVEDEPEVTAAIENLTACPGWKPYPYPCEFRRKGCEGIDGI